MRRLPIRKKTALSAYLLNLAKFKIQTDKSTETRLKLVERNVLPQNFGYAALDMTRTWKAAWKVRLDIN